MSNWDNFLITILNNKFIRKIQLLFTNLDYGRQCNGK
jgi:hypothetical protein